jgi:hypothetical protein
VGDWRRDCGLPVAICRLNSSYRSSAGGARDARVEGGLHAVGRGWGAGRSTRRRFAAALVRASFSHEPAGDFLSWIDFAAEPYFVPCARAAPCGQLGEGLAQHARASPRRHIGAGLRFGTFRVRIFRDGSNLRAARSGVSLAHGSGIARGCGPEWAPVDNVAGTVRTSGGPACGCCSGGATASGVRAC